MLRLIEDTDVSDGRTGGRKSDEPRDKLTLEPFEIDVATSKSSLEREFPMSNSLVGGNVSANASRRGKEGRRTSKRRPRRSRDD